MASWDFVLPKHEPNTKYTIKDPDFAYIPRFPNDLVVNHNLPRLVSTYNPLLRVVSSDVSAMYDLHCLTASEDSLSHSQLTMHFS